MKLFDILIKTPKWYEKLLLPFAKTYITCDVSFDKNVFCKSKKLFGKLYLVKMWEEKPKWRRGVGIDYITYDEAGDIDCETYINLKKLVGSKPCE